jgi:hypothetical protein
MERVIDDGTTSWLILKIIPISDERQLIKVQSKKAFSNLSILNKKKSKIN